MTDSKMTDTTSSQDFDTSTHYLGKVKWFNNKTGYGFCTIIGEAGTDRVGEDIFVHHTGVKVASEQYKYLVQGEYVHFSLRSSDSNTHPYQAADLTGPWNGPLMCETRNEQRQQRVEREGNGDERHDNHRDNRGDGRRDNRGDGRRDNRGDNRRDNRRDNRGARTVRLKGSGPREEATWTLAAGDETTCGDQ